MAQQQQEQQVSHLHYFVFHYVRRITKLISFFWVLTGIQRFVSQEEGWPLGLRPLNARVGMLRNQDFNGSISFATTMLTRSTSSTTDSSSDLDTESTGSFFHDKSITLGSLIGFSSILELSRRSTRGRGGRSSSLREQQHSNNSYKPKPWIFSLCSRLTTDAVNTNSTNNNSSNHPPSLGHFLQVERRAAVACGNNSNASTNSHDNGSVSPRTLVYGPNDFSPIAESVGGSVMNSLFVGGEIAAPQVAEDDGGGRRRSSNNNDTNSSSSSKLLGHGDGYGPPLMLSCLCGQLIE
ncbi:unnamed protein product [Linum tenue]|uniref:Uncharacterized protein n=1 Tax=Linum tenue TaxID=586396 RepID=A0AAV0PRB8_9ROSI|nr:unnamed protein product [Linum tenue]